MISLETYGTKPSCTSAGGGHAYAVLCHFGLDDAVAGYRRSASARPAGVKPAQIDKTTEIYLFGVAAIVAAGLGLVMIKSSSSTATTGTSG
jgi:hypothetical protein